MVEVWPLFVFLKGEKEVEEAEGERKSFNDYT
jgi:hypothetical protein